MELNNENDKNEVSNDVIQVFGDTETSGKSHKLHRVIEIGLVKRINGVIVDEYHRYFNINKDDLWEPEAEKVHGIKRESLADKPYFIECADEIIDFLKGATFIAHNAPFDVDFLNKELVTSGKPELHEFVNKVEDSLKISKAVRPKQKASLDALMKAFNIDASAREEYHSAIVDTKLLIPVYDELIKLRAGRYVDYESDIPRSEIKRINLDDFIQKTNNLISGNNTPFVLPTINISENDKKLNELILDDIQKEENVTPVARLTETKTEEKTEFSLPAAKHGLF